jgi:hypothetical protein
MAVAGNDVVDKVVRLYHRRRGWAWTGFGSLIGVFIYLIIGTVFFQNLAGTAETISVVPVFALLALTVAGLATALADTVRLRRYRPAIREDARARVSHHPVYAHAHRYPPRHFGSWVAGIFMILCIAGLTVPFLPREVNAVAYLAGAESQATFYPVGYAQDCSKSGCSTVTDGYLSGSGANVTWPDDVPLSRPFPVRVPAWDWFTGVNLITSTGSAVGALLIGLFFNGVALLFLSILVLVFRVRRTTARMTRQRGAASPGRYSPDARDRPQPGPARARRSGTWQAMPPVGDSIATRRADPPEDPPR